jgi:Flp pilus assembly protein TadD
MIYQRLNRLGDAEAAYHAALKENPGIAPAYNNLAMITLKRGGNLSNALAWAQKGVELAPSVPQFHDTLGWVYRAQGDKAKAIAALERAVSLPPPQAEIVYHLGIVYEEAGQKQNAAAAYRKALSIQADFPQAKDARARLAALK